MYLFSFVILVLNNSSAYRGTKKKKQVKVEDKKAAKDKYAEKIKNADVHEGLFTLYRDADKETFI